MNKTTNMVTVVIVVLVVIAIGFVVVQHNDTYPAQTTENPMTPAPVPDQNPAPVEPPSNSNAYNYGTVALAVGKTAIFSDISLSVASVADSRCPTHVVCIQAGTATVSFAVASSSGSMTESLSVGQSVTISGVKITLVSVDPYPAEGQTTLQSAYVVTFNVAK